MNSLFAVIRTSFVNMQTKLRNKIRRLNNALFCDWCCLLLLSMLLRLLLLLTLPSSSLLMPLPCK